MATFSEYTNKKKKKQSFEDYTRGVVGDEFFDKQEDIAPITLTEQEQQMGGQKDERKWFQKGAFEDGYQFGDVLKTIESSAKDLETNVMAGVLGIGEGVVDAGAYLVGGIGSLFNKDFGEKTKEFISKDLYDQEEIARKIVGARTPLAWFDKDIMKEENSVFGEKTDSLAQSGGQLLGTAALGTVGVPWFLTTGVTSFGGEVDNAFDQGANYGQAGLSAAITAGAEILTEKLSGGINFGAGTADDFLMKQLTTKISNKALRTAAKFGLDVAGEGAEEVLSQFMSNLGSSLYKEENLKDILFSEEALDGYLESFIGGGVLGGGGSVHTGVVSAIHNRDATSGMTAREEAVFKKIYDTRIEEAQKNAEKEGKKLSVREKNKIYDEVLNELDRGYVSTDTIEEVLGGESYTAYKKYADQEDALQKEFDKLGNMKKGDFTAKQDDRYNELKQKLAEMKESNQRETLKAKLSEEVQNSFMRDNNGESELIDKRLYESYAERARRGQAFEADLSKYDAKQQETIKKAVESGILNNTNRTHEFVDMVSKISADKGVLFDFTNNERLKESGFAVDGKEVNGYVTKDGITVNIDSHKALNTIVGHEVTHVLEGTEHYAEMQKALFQYAQSKGDLDSRRQSLSELYKNVKDADVEAELTADLVGDYLFTDRDFVNHLARTNRNVFQKIYDEIKHLWDLATAGSKEARELEKAMHLFEKAYKESGKAQSDTKYSLSDSDGKQLTKGQQEFLKDSKIRDYKGNILVCYHATDANFTVFDKAKIGSGNGGALFGKGFYFTPNRSMSEDYGDTVGQYYLNIKNPFEYYTVDKEYIVDMLEKSGYEYDKDFVDFYDFDNLWDGDLIDDFLRDALPGKDIYAEFSKMVQKAGFDGIWAESEIIAFEPNQIKRTDNLNPTSNPDIRYSLSDSDGKKLTTEQQEYFKDSKMRDENGNLKVMYHGSQDAGFHVFDPAHSDDDTSLFFVDRNDVAASYSGTTETYEAQSIRTAEDMNKFIKSIDAEGYEVVENNGKFTLLYEGDRVADSKTAKGIYEEFCWYEGVGDGDANYKVYLNLTNPLEVDGKGRPWNKIDAEFSQEVYDKYKSLTAEEKAALTDLAEWEDFRIFNSEIQEAQGNDLASAYAKMGEDVNIYDLFSVAADNFSEESMRENARRYLKTRDFAQRAKEQGYDGVIFKNIIDNGGYSNGDEGASTVAIAFDSNQIKSVANDKPTKNADIRYSLSSDNEGRELSPAVKSRFGNSKVVDENGSLKVVYHGTASGEFSIFDKSKGSVEGDFGSGFYFTDNEADVSEHYEGGGPDFDNKVARRAEQIEAEEEIDYDEAEKRAREELYKGSHKFEVYLNIENPAIVGETMLLTQEDYLEQYNEEDYDDYDDYIADCEQLLADDIENIVFEVERNTGAYRTDGLANVLYDAYYEGGIGIEELKSKINDLYLEDENGNLIGNEVARQVIESLGYDGIIDPTVSGKWNMDMEDGTTHYIVFKPNQIKAVTNQNPTDNPDIHRSLSAKGEAPVKYGNFNISGDDVRFEAPMQEQVAPMAEEAPKTESTTLNMGAPITEDEANALQSENIDSLTDADAPPEMEAPYYGETEDIAPKDPFDNRDIKDVGNRKVKAYMYENPEVKPFFQKEANIMLGELRDTTKGERIYTEVEGGVPGEYGAESYGVWTGTSRQTSADIEYLLDTQGYSYAQIEKGLNAIIEDNGAENNAVSKRIEFLLNDRLMNGYQTMDGYDIPADQDYINLLNEKQITEYSEEARKSFFDVADAYAPQEDIAPVKEQYEAIRPKREKSTEPRLKRVDSKSANGKQRKWIGTSTDSDAVDGKVKPEDIPDDMRYYQPIPNKVTLGNANSRLNNMGYDSAVSYFNSQFANKRVSLDDIALGERLIQEAVKRGDTKTAGELIQNVAILGTELGQKVQALSIIKRLTPEGQLRMLQKTVERGKTKGDKSFEGVEITQEMIDHILKTYGKDGTYDQTKLNEAVEDVKKKIADQMNVTKLEKVNAWRYLSMLGNPKTHIRNLVSNVAMRGTLAVKNAVARTIESFAPIGERTKTWKRATDAVKAFSQKTAMEMKDVLSDGGKYSEEASIKAKRDTFKNKILNGAYNFNSDLLSKEDWWFSKPAFTNALSEYLTANGIKTEQDIKENPKIVAKAKQYATEQSQIATFRQYSWLANKINDIEKHNAATNIAVGAVLPFKKTPINIAKTALNYSPLGFTKTLTYDIAQVKNGKMEASELVDHLSQNITGLALPLVGYLLASSGFLNGAGEDDKEGKYDYQLGEQAYSINIGDATFSLSWLSPIAMPLFVGANAFEQFVEGKEWNGDVVVQTLAQTLDPLSEMSFLSSLDSVLSSYDSGIMKFAGIAQTAAQSYTTQFVPTLLSQVAAVMDDTKRTTKVAGDSTFKAFDEIINNLKYKIPGLRETLEPTTDIWGNEVKQTEDMLTRAFETFIAPYSKREDISTEIDSEIKSLYSMTGDDGLIPSIPYNYINYKNEKYEMSAEEYTAYKEAYGQTAYNLLGELFDTETYQYASDEDKAEMVNKVYDYARDLAKKEFLAKKGVTYTNATEDGEAIYREDTIKGAIEHNMTIDEYAFYRDYPEKYAVAKSVGGYEKYKTYTSELYDIKADKDEDGKSITGSRKEKVAEYINNLDADYGEKIILFKSEYQADDSYNYEIIEYLNSREDISYEEMVTILKELGFTVKGDTVTWD